MMHRLAIKRSDQHSAKKLSGNIAMGRSDKCCQGSKIDFRLKLKIIIVMLTTAFADNGLQL